MTPEQQAAIAAAKARISQRQPQGFSAQQQAAIEAARARISQPVAPAAPERVDPSTLPMTLAQRIGQGQPTQVDGQLQTLTGQPDMAPTVTAGDGSEMVYNPSTGQYTSRELLANNMRPSQMEALQAGSARGITFGLGDEVAGAIGGPFAREKVRAAQDAAARDYPVTSAVGEIGGSLALPAGAAGRAANLGEAVVQGAKAGAVLGGGYAAANSEGGVINRVSDGIEGAIGGTLFGAAAPVVVNVGTKAFRNLFQRAAERPEIGTLKMAKNAAYRAVDEAGERFSADDMAALNQTVRNELAGSNYVEGVDTQTDAVLRLLDKKSISDISLGQLDKLRQDMWSRYNKATNEVGILDAIDAVDELVASRASTNELMDAARLANSQYKKAELLDLAFQKARDQTASTGSGGNILNKYRQAVTSIINNPKQAKWFNGEEVAAMRNFIEGSIPQNTLRRIGKLSPSGNGLMLALNLGATAINPAMIGVAAVGAGAKAISDRAVERGADALISRVSGQLGQQASAPVNYGALNRLSGVAGQPIGSGLIDRYGP